MIDPKLTDIMMEMVTSTLNMMDHGQELSPKKRLLQFLLHRTHFILMNFHSRLSPEIELLMIDPKHMDIMMEMVTLTLNTMDHGKELSPKKRQLQFLPHRTHFTPMNFHSKLSPEIELLMIDPKLMVTMTAMVMSTPSMTDHGKVLD